MARKSSEKVQLKLRMREPVRAAIEKAAKLRGVSMNTEINARLDQSFEHETIVDRVLSGESGNLARLIITAIQAVERATGKQSRNDSYTAAQARLAADTILDAELARPGTKKVKASPKLLLKLTDGLPPDIASEMMEYLGATIASNLIGRPWEGATMTVYSSPSVAPKRS